MTTWSPFERRCATASVAAIPEANARPQRPPSSAARQVSRAVRVGLPVRAYSYPLFFPTASCANVEVWKMGTTTAPVAASGSCPAWMASVSNPGLRGVSFTSLQYAETLARPAPDLEALDRALIQPLVSRGLAGDESIQPGALVEGGAHPGANRIHERTDIRVRGQLAGKLQGDVALREDPAKGPHF